MSGGKKLHVAVLMGGSSSEREVSLSTGSMILKALDASKYDAYAIDIIDLFELSSRPDIVFIALHGKGGEDGSVQGMLDLMQIPYTGSGVLASALAMNKSKTKQLLRPMGVPFIPDISFSKSDINRCEECILNTVSEELGFPVFVKPNSEGSTFGCSLVEVESDLIPAIRNALEFDSEALVEAYIPGIEITVGILGNSRSDLKVLSAIEIVPESKFYDYQSKYTEGGSRHIIPARISDKHLKRARQYAEACHIELGCRGMSRTDMIVRGDDIFVLEINTIPGMTPTSLLPDAAAHDGIEFPELLNMLINYALTAEY